MAKSQMFGRNALLDYIYRVGGVFPVMRGHHDEDTFITAHSILDRGGCVLCTRRADAPAPAASASRSPASAGWRSSPGPRRPGRDPRITGRTRLEAPLLSQGHRAVRRAAGLRRRRASTREQQREAATEVFDRVKAMYSALDERGRSSVIKSLRDGAADAVAGASTRTEPYS